MASGVGLVPTLSYCEKNNFSVAFLITWLDRDVMNHGITNSTELSSDQQKALVNIISDQSGHNLSYDDFTDQVLSLLDDIAGFEVISDSESEILINQLWSYYHGSDK